jgi:hypothetical protein
MKITVKQLRSIIKEEARKVIRETRESVSNLELRDAFDEIYLEGGYVSIEDLESALAVYPGAITDQQLFDVGLKLDEDGTVTDI